MSESVMELRPVSSEIQLNSRESWGRTTDGDDFDYIPVSPIGPIALSIGVISLSGFFGMFGLYVALAGVVTGIIALVRIRGEQGTVKGGGFAAAGLILSVLCLTLGSAKMAYAYSTECPEGFLRVSFPNEISKKQFIYNPMRRLHPEVAPLIGQKVFLKGFMWQTRMDEGLTDFVLLKDNGECCFGGKAQPYDMMLVRLPEGKTTRAYQSMVAVAGVLSADVNAPEDAAVYTLDAEIVEEAQTGF